MSIENLEALFKHELDDIYAAEQTNLSALKDLVDETQDENIVDTLRQHTNETEEQIGRLEEIFEKLDRSPSQEECEGIQGLLQERQELKTEVSDPALLNVVNLMAAQKTEHYEVSAYNALSLLANRLGMQEADQLLQQNRNEEEEMLNRLSKLAEGYDFDAVQTT